ncbi:FAD-dependent 5-carboxymethylaminomethyl-2-thiouridine(34) oxidoreductase MnmC [Skermanella mucosa]|uniref:FAD-dependent 5-carboxymethylaminomethyl-2-thiouridine(34) oxidoreductase MnmC n=1 Tax=Skermanella mucosa TaxID=1789672 RepID=UPI00192B6617|nr:FAD-dependent 5-carboxymethylaminomethyl-2-thiouridine(34) oxidoreductase MnmC [Skermanella mucosa]UEM22129.1 FAD-dependent 5-carboxymethylaminomethyl-2-thiouridine(34) oxidoreductase MnmC [Skermanella mucosa]
MTGVPPWFTPPPPASAPGRALVVGGGIAGAAAAAALARRGWRVTLAERRGRIAAEASGNPAGIHMPRLVAGRSPERTFHAEAYLHGLRTLARLGPAVARSACGVLRLATDDRQAERHEAALRTPVLPPEMVRAVGPDEAGELAGIPIRHRALWFPEAGWVDPASFARALLDGTAAVRLNTGIAELVHDGFLWHAAGADGTALEPAEAVVLANGLDARAFSQSAWLSLSPRRGQVTVVQATRRSASLRCVISHGGYLLPAREGRHLIGATFDTVEDQVPAAAQEPEATDDTRNLAEAESLFPGLFEGAGTPMGRASLRAMTADHLPLVGPVVDRDRFVEDFAGLRHGRPERSFAAAVCHPGLWVMAGLGARGLVTAPFAADLLAAQICGGPWPVDPDAASGLMAALHPARFLVRELKRRKL